MLGEQVGGTLHGGPCAARCGGCPLSGMMLLVGNVVSGGGGVVFCKKEQAPDVKWSLKEEG